ncbi:MAG TPA: ABC transporter permease [Geobacteraceae bacterium]|nr:ABC transporter permease [Geobacteraceae bacterium]
MAQPGLRIEKEDVGTLRLFLDGEWKLANNIPSPREVEGILSAEPDITRASFDTNGLEGWDSGLLTFLLSVMDQCTLKKVDVDRDGLPSGVNRLLALATAVPERQGARRGEARVPFLERVGVSAIDFRRSLLDMVAFIGETFTSFVRLFTGRARFRGSDMLLILQECSADALPIVSLISLLVGLILAFVGAIQLKLFGAQIYVADLVGIGMVRAMGAIMTGIIIAGRTGAAFAASIGTMQVNEEIDALQTTGVSPMDFLVLPRVLALSLMMPLLTIYADLMGILGGLIVGVLGLDLSAMEYYQETKKAIGLTNVWIGLFSGFVYGVLVAMAGCMRGMRCGRSASAVGDATTSAVVTSIVSIVVATAIITVLCDILGI